MAGPPIVATSEHADRVDLTLVISRSRGRLDIKGSMHAATKSRNTLAMTPITNRRDIRDAARRTSLKLAVYLDKPPSLSLIIITSLLPHCVCTRPLYLEDTVLACAHIVADSSAFERSMVVLVGRSSIMIAVEQRLEVGSTPH